MKALKFLSLLMFGAATLTLGGCRGSQGEEDEPGTGPGTTPSDTEFVVSVDKHFIYNNGTDAVTFTATFEGTALSESDVVAYNATTNEVVTLAGLTFSTSAEGTVVSKFYFTYTDAAATLHTSDTINIVSGTERPLDLSNDGSKGVTISASIGALQVSVDEAIIFVRRDGQLQNAEDIKVYNKKNDAEVALPSKEYVDFNGVAYTLPYFKSDELGVFEFYAMVGTKNSDYDNPLRITVTEQAVPKAPADPQPENLNFHRRSLLMQYTGTGCGWCPEMIYAIRQLYLDEDTADKFVLAAIHNYGSANDPMQIEKPYSNLGNMMMPGVGWPQTITDFYVANDIRDQAILKATFLQAQTTLGTQAGISVATTYSNGSVVALVRVKANTENDFRVGAWLVEDDVVAEQANNSANTYPYSEEDFNTHEAAVRIADSNRSSSNFTGYDLGTLKAGEYGDYLFTMTVKDGWVADNCRLVVFATSKVDGSYYVTNVIETESLNDIVEIQYAE